MCVRECQPLHCALRLWTLVAPDVSSATLQVQRRRADEKKKRKKNGRRADTAVINTLFGVFTHISSPSLKWWRRAIRTAKRASELIVPTYNSLLLLPHSSPPSLLLTFKLQKHSFCRDDPGCSRGVVGGGTDRMIEGRQEFSRARRYFLIRQQSVSQSVSPDPPISHTTTRWAECDVTTRQNPASEPEMVKITRVKGHEGRNEACWHLILSLLGQ